MYYVIIDFTGMLYKSAEEKIYAEVRSILILPQGVRVAIRPGGIVLDANKNLTINYTSRSYDDTRPSFEDTEYVPFLDHEDGVQSAWDENDVKDYIGSNTYSVTVNIVDPNGNVLATNPGEETITKNSDIEID